MSQRSGPRRTTSRAPGPTITSQQVEHSLSAAESMPELIRAEAVENESEPVDEQRREVLLGRTGPPSATDRAPAPADRRLPPSAEAAAGVPVAVDRRIGRAGGRTTVSRGRTRAVQPSCPGCRTTSLDRVRPDAGCGGRAHHRDGPAGRSARSLRSSPRRAGRRRVPGVGRAFRAMRRHQAPPSGRSLRRIAPTSAVRRSQHAHVGAAAPNGHRAVGAARPSRSARNSRQSPASPGRAVVRRAPQASDDRPARATPRPSSLFNRREPGRRN